MKDIYLDNLGYALGSEKNNVAEGSKDYFSPRRSLIDSGFENHYTCSTAQTPYCLAREAVDRIANSLTHKGESITTIDTIIYATCLTRNGNLGSWDIFAETSDVKPLMDFPVSHLQADFHMDKAFVLGINQMACTSLLGSIRVAKSLLISEPDLKKVLCLTADRFPQGAIYEQGFNVISDGAAGCVVRSDGGAYKILDCHHITNGAMAQASDDETAGFYFNYTHRLITESLARAGITIDDVRFFVPQNTNIKAWQVICSLLGFPFEQVLMPTRTAIGHCISGDNIINLDHCEQNNLITSGDIILLPMAGFGLNWSCITLQKV